MTFQRVMSEADLWSGELTALEVGGAKIVIVRLGDHVYAYEDRCAHQGVALSKGKLEGSTLRCSAHHWEYDAATGEGVNPCSAHLKKFAVRIQDGSIWIDCEARHA